MQGSAGGSYVTADWFTGSLIGNADTATKLKNARNIFGKSFNGTADIAGQALVYGTYTSTAGQRYANGGLQIREAGLVGNAQTDIGYAPSIGFHWSGKKAASLLFHHDGLFYFRAQDGTTRATVDANLQGNASTATALTSSAGSGTQPIYFSNGKPVATTYALHKTVPSNAVFTDTNVIQGKSTTVNWRPILSHNVSNGTYGTDPGEATGGVYYTPSIAIQPSTGTLRATKFIGEFEGTITNAKRLSNYYSTRPATISPGVTGDGSVITFKCTSSVTDTDDPGDGHVLHFNWDNDGGYDSQILMMTSSSTMKYRGMSGKTWQPWVTSIDSGNYTQYTVKKDGTGASGTWNISINGTASKATADADGNTIKTTYAKLKSMNDLIYAGNEFTFVSSAYSGTVWINYRTASGSTDGNISKYIFGNGKGGSLATISNGQFSGNAATATNVAWSGVTSKPSYYDAKAIKGITRSGTTFTYTCMDGTTGTFTQQDANYYHTASYSTGLVIATSTSLNSLYVPYAGSSQAGAVSTGAQTFAGSKTFSSAMTVNSTITFGEDDGYGIRTTTNNYCRIGESGKMFYQAYVTNYFGTSLGSSSTKFTNAYITNIYGTNLGSTSSKFTQAYITTIGSSTYPCTSVYATTFYASSDIRKKKNIFEYNSSGDILTLPIYKFDYKDGTGINQIGCMAQDLQKICPELVKADADGYLSIKENRLVYILLDRMKKMQKEIDELKEERQNG